MNTNPALEEEIQKLAFETIGYLQAAGEEVPEELQNLLKEDEPVPLDFKSTGHVRHPFPFLSFLLAVLFVLPSLFAHFYNPCITYSPVIMYTIGFTFVAFTLLICTNLTMRDWCTQYCTEEYLQNHICLEVWFFSSLGSSICAYSIWAYSFNAFAGIWELIMMFGIGWIYGPIFFHRHYRSCAFRGHDHYEITSGSRKDHLNFVYFADIVGLIFIVAIIIVSFSINTYFYNNDLPRPSESCLL